MAVMQERPGTHWEAEQDDRMYRIFRMQFSDSDSTITWHVPQPEPMRMNAMHERPGLTGRQKRMTRMYRTPRTQFRGSDSTMAQGTVLSALLVSSANCAGLHTTQHSLL